MTSANERAAAPTPPAAEAPGQEPVADEIERVKAAIAYVIAKGDGLFLDAVSRTAILAMDRRAEVVEQKFYHSGWPMVRLLEARHGGMVIDEGEAWFYSHTSKDGFGGAYDLLYRRATPPAPAEPAHGLNLETNPAMRERLVELSEQGATDDYDRVVMMLVRDFARCMAHIAPLQDFAARHASPPAPAVAVPEGGEAIIRELAHIRLAMLDLPTAAKILQRLVDKAQSVLAAAPEPPATRSEEQPPYPEGEVVGPCVCGGWPGGRCLRCPWRPATRPEAEIRNEGIEMAAKDTELAASEFDASSDIRRALLFRAKRIRALKEPGDEH